MGDGVGDSVGEGVGDGVMVGGINSSTWLVSCSLNVIMTNKVTVSRSKSNRNLLRSIR